MHKNLFITGPVRTGKSTLLKTMIDPFAFLTGGFFVQRLIIRGKTKAFRLVDIAAESYFPNRQVTSLDDFTDFIMVIDKERKYNHKVFRINGVRALKRACREKQLILMDELGRIETKVPEFMEAVFKALDSDIPVLGVLKDERNFFLDQIRERSDVRIIRKDSDPNWVRGQIQEFLSQVSKKERLSDVQRD
ncbi:MAG: nucleoside-triphosphatase [Desulfitobacteriia bacterium]|jgi:nucleoside-triphosphatase